MSKGTKIAVYAVLVFGASMFVWRFRTQYSQFMAQGEVQRTARIEQAVSASGEAKASPARTVTYLGAWGAGMVLTLVALGLLAAHDVSQFLGARALDVIYNDEGAGIADPGYDQAEEEWARGNFLEAVRLLREYLKENPRELHAALRIAEIYEKDLQNYLAAVLEYEEVLKHKLPPERWGWAAIHLCNLYNSKVNQPEKAIALLQRIAGEYGGTAAAEKARKRLAQLEEEGVIQPSSETAGEAGNPANDLPPGFTPKKN